MAVTTPISSRSDTDMRRPRAPLVSLLRDALFAAILVISKEMLAFLPNVEMVSMLLMAYTAVYRFRALVPLYVFVAIEMILYPMGTFLYLYVWLFLWAAILLIPRRFLCLPVYVVTSAIFGLAFGTLCAPAQAFIFGLDAAGTMAWILAGLPWDVVHAIGNAALATLTPVLCRLLRQIEIRTT